MNKILFVILFFILAIFIYIFSINNKTSNHLKSIKMTPEKPLYITELEAYYGKPNQSAFGSTVLVDTVTDISELEQTALAKYKYFAGEQWAKNEQGFKSAWKEVYVRGNEKNIVSELQRITDENAKLSVPMLLDNLENAAEAKKALSAAYDDASVQTLRVYTTGDGEALSGLLIAGRRESGETIFLVFMMD